LHSWIGFGISLRSLCRRGAYDDSITLDWPDRGRQGWNEVVVLASRGRCNRRGAAEKGGCCREGISPASCRVPRQEQKIGSHPNRGMAFGQSLLSRAPRHARVKFGDEFDRREIARNASASYDSTGFIVVASAGSHSTSPPSSIFYSPRLLQSRREPFRQCPH
jgi:hypothetical protein